MLNLLGCTRSCHGTPVLAFNVQVCHNFVHIAAKHALQRHLQHVKQTTQRELNTVDAHYDATVTANGSACLSKATRPPTEVCVTGTMGSQHSTMEP
jgi:hypothetical protein